MVAPFPEVPARDVLRRIFEALTDADRKAVFIDCFPKFISRLSDSMDARHQVNLLLSLHGDAEVWAALSKAAERDSVVSACIRRQIQDGARQRPVRVALPPRNGLFTGREAALAALHQALHQHRGVAIIGLGGLGKSSLALEYVYQHAGEYLLVYWLSGADAYTLGLGLLDLGHHLQNCGLVELPASSEQHPEVLLAYVRSWLSGHSNWLLVLDNADDLEPLRTLLPDFSRGFLIATTRAIDPLVLGLSQIALSEFSPDEAITLLSRRRGATPQSSDEAGELRELAKELGHLPLALEQAGAYMAAHQTPVRSYLSAYHQRRAALFPPSVSGQQRRSVTTVWSLTFDMLERENSASADLLRVSAFLSPDFIPEQLLHAEASHVSEALAAALACEHPLAIDELLGPLLHHSLVRRVPPDIKGEGKGGYSLHRLVQDVMRLRLGTEERIWCERTVRFFNAAFSGNETTKWQSMTLLPWADDLFGHIERLGLVLPEAARLINLAAKFLDNFASHARSGPLLRRALKMYEQVRGQDHPDTAESANNLGWLLRSQGMLHDAEPLLRRALVIRERVLGLNHPDTGASANNLAYLLEDQGKVAEAEDLHRRGLAIREHLFGVDSSDTAWSMNNLAFRLFGQGKLDEAEKLCRRALEINEQWHGSENPRIVQSLTNLAGLLEGQGKLDEAEFLCRRAVYNCNLAFGLDHRRTNRARRNLNALLARRKSGFASSQ